MPTPAAPEPNIANTLYLAMIPARQFCQPSDWLSGLAVYYDPGAVSYSSHETLSYCFLEHFDDGPAAYSSQDAYLLPDMAQRAISRLNQRLRALQANLPPGWPAGIHPEMRTRAEQLYRLAYFEPNHNFIASLLNQVTNSRLLSPNQLSALDQIAKQAGSLDAMRNRQRIRWRLMRLSELELEPDDQLTIDRFTQYANSLSGLHQNKWPVITAIEQAYWEQRQELTLIRAARIAALLRQLKENKE
jgi:hypothetical protein